MADDDRSADERRDGRVPWLIFATIGASVGVMASVYWLMSYEHAGSVMLTIAALLSLWTGSYLWLRERRASTDRPDAEVAGHSWEPHASAWPLGLAAGLVLVLNGLLIGTWFLVPGVTLLVVSIGGFANESRRRT